MEAGLLEMLLAAPWVRAGCTLGTDPYGRDADEHGLLLLSRLPVREAAVHVLRPHKAVTAVVVTTAAGPLTVAATHLSSDHSAEGPARRQAELERLAEGLAGVAGDLVLLGDLNDWREGPDGPAAVLGLRDAWTEVHGPHDHTPTFDPGAKPLAALASLSGRAARLDRILPRGDGLRVAGAELLGDKPTPQGLYVSDHYGVAAVLRPDGDGGPPGVPEDREEASGVASADPADGPGDGDRAGRIVRRVAKALGEGTVHLVGSRRTGCALPGADVDLVAVLTVAPPPGEDLEEVLGAVRGRMRALLTALEEAGAADAHAWPRPVETGPGLVRYAVGLGRTPPGAATVAALARRWGGGLPGVGVEMVAGGAAPTPR
ncbi:endonuclease/exonuclease/phosphatase family protein [Streptomyces sp. TRM 70361]|uniref:endonuclease/exonuclease/phosphatase family protein n=1 Tax=Streptomyces sp. TRM 70361 TaxID=3116553 RepID=UPI003FCC730E